MLEKYHVIRVSVEIFHLLIYFITFADRGTNSILFNFSRAYVWFSINGSQNGLPSTLLSCGITFLKSINGTANRTHDQKKELKERKKELNANFNQFYCFLFVWHFRHRRCRDVSMYNVFVYMFCECKVDHGQVVAQMFIKKQ